MRIRPRLASECTRWLDVSVLRGDLEILAQRFCERNEVQRWGRNDDL